jgi:hypothetical protein
MPDYPPPGMIANTPGAFGETVQTPALVDQSTLAPFPSPTSNPTAVTPVSGTAQQISTTKNTHIVIPVTYTPTAGAAATCDVAIGPTSGVAFDLGTITVPLGVANDSFIDYVSIMVPAGWYVKLTVVNATIGAGYYY